jgi:hypothetical protein
MNAVYILEKHLIVFFGLLLVMMSPNGMFVLSGVMTCWIVVVCFVGDDVETSDLVVV